MAESEWSADREREVRAAFCRAQEISEGEAAKIVAKLAGGDDDIWSSVVHWARSGEFSDVPVVEGYSPRILSDRLPATMVFTALAELRRRPRQARSALQKHGRGVGLSDSPRSAGTQ
jgi:hypothetical protein